MVILKAKFSVNYVGHILRRTFLLHDAIEGQMTELKGVGRRRTQLLDNLINRRYWELKKEAKNRKKRWKRYFINQLGRKNPSIYKHLAYSRKFPLYNISIYCLKCILFYTIFYCYFYMYLLFDLIICLRFTYLEN